MVRDSGMNKLTPDDAFELGNQFRDAAILLGHWRIRNRSELTKSERNELNDRELRLLNTASSIGAIGLLVDSRPSAVHLRSNVKAAKSAAQHTITPKHAPDLAFALFLFAAAVFSAKGAAIPAAIEALSDAVTAIVQKVGNEGA
jgi:hypothetical protein